MGNWHSWKYKNLTFFFFSFFLAFFLFQQPSFHSLLLNLGNFSYLGAFIAGTLFISTFTVATGGTILIILTEKLSPLEIALIAGLGGAVGDLTIFKLVKDGLSNGLKEIYDKIDSRHHLIKILHTRYFSWTLPVLGAVIIASPFPDEIGITLLGISKMKTYKFFLLALLLDTIGIFLIVSAVAATK